MRWRSLGQDKAARSCTATGYKSIGSTKSSFDDKAAAEKVAKAIKKAHPVVQVAIYDAESNERALIDA